MLFLLKCFSSKAPATLLPTKYQIHPELPNKIFSSAIYELLCSYITGCYGAERALCFTAHRLMTLAVGHSPRLSGRSLCCFCLVHILITSTANHLLPTCAPIRCTSLERAASAGFSCRIFLSFTRLWMEWKRKPPGFKLADHALTLVPHSLTLYTIALSSVDPICARFL